MSYADSLLSTGERITHRVRQHWLTLLWGARLPIVAILAALLLLILSRNVEGAAQTLLGWLTLILFVGGLAFLAWATMRYLNTEFVLTNRRVIQVEGVVNKRATDSSLEKINDAVLTQSIFGRMFGFGDLDVLTAAEAGIERFRMIIDPIGFKRAMLDAKHEYEVDMERAGWQPSPPIRAAAGAGAGAGPAVNAGPAVAAPVAMSMAAAPATPHPGSSGFTATPAAAHPGSSGFTGTPAAAHPGSSGFTATPASSGFTGAPASSGFTATPSSGAPVAAAAAKVNPDEVTRTLSSLADLRDRGAISAEEYEAKKTDLLGRL